MDRADPPTGVWELTVDLPDLDAADDLLAQPTRRQLFGILVELGGAASTEELARRIGMHPNGVRTQLARMADAGLLERRRAARPRGRPRDEWAVSPSAHPGGGAPRAYRELAAWLARAVPATGEGLRSVEETGRAIGRELAHPEAGPPAQAFTDALAALGFQPRTAPEPGGRFRCRLGNCPYRASVRADADVVCTLHRGLTLGLLDRLAPAAALVRFVPHDPDVAGCEIDVEGLAG
jgi:predicted ArsR family transcriptional regulator